MKNNVYFYIFLLMIFTGIILTIVSLYVNGDSLTQQNRKRLLLSLGLILIAFGFFGAIFNNNYFQNLSRKKDFEKIVYNRPILLDAGRKRC